MVVTNLKIWSCWPRDSNLILWKINSQNFRRQWNNSKGEAQLSLTEPQQQVEDMKQLTHKKVYLSGSEIVMLKKSIYFSSQMPHIMSHMQVNLEQLFKMKRFFYSNVFLQRFCLGHSLLPGPDLANRSAAKPVSWARDCRNAALKSVPELQWVLAYPQGPELQSLRTLSLLTSMSPDNFYAPTPAVNLLWLGSFITT